ncbi:hypothetical protein IWX49DRAFT_589027 [Phyllosticta citricarpa]
MAAERMATGSITIRDLSPISNRSPLLLQQDMELRQWSRDNGQPHAGMIPNAAPGLSGPERRDNRVTSANTNGVAEFDGRNGHPHHPQHAGGSKNHHAPQPGRSTPVPIQHLVPRYGLRQSSESHVHPAMRSIPPSLEPVYGAFEETMAAAQPRPEHHRTVLHIQGRVLPLVLDHRRRNMSGSALSQFYALIRSSMDGDHSNNHIQGMETPLDRLRDHHGLGLRIQDHDFHRKGLQLGGLRIQDRLQDRLQVLYMDHHGQVLRVGDPSL